MIIFVVLIVGAAVTNTIREGKPVEYVPSENEEEQIANDQVMDTDNAVYLYSDAVEGYRSPIHGAVAFNWELSSWLSRDDVRRSGLQDIHQSIQQ